MDGQQNPGQQAPVNTNKSQTGTIVAIVGIIVIVVAGVVAAQTMNKPQTPTQNTTTVTEQSGGQQQTTQPAGEQPAAEQTAAYKDGTYKAVGNYTSPGGAEEIGVTLTLSDGVVTSSVVEVLGTRPMTKAKQTEFSQNYKPQVEGRNIDEIVLTKVAGSSLSPKGFNDAVEKIKAQAQS